MGSSSLERTVRVGNGASGVIVEVCLDVAAHDTTECPDQVVDLSRSGTTNGVRDTDSVHTDLVDSLVDGEQVDQIAAERVLRAESDFLALRLDVLNDLNRGVLNVCHVLAMAVLHQMAARSNDHVNAVHSGCDGELGILHVTSHVCEDLGLQSELADSLAVQSRLLRSGRRCEFDVVDTKLVEELGDLDLGLGVEEGIGKLLTLTEGRLDDLEVANIAQVVLNGCVWVARLRS